MTSEEVKVQIQKELEKSREQNKAMLQETMLRFYQRIFEERGSMEKEK